MEQKQRGSNQVNWIILHQVATDSSSNLGLGAGSDARVMAVGTLLVENRILRGQNLSPGIRFPWPYLN